MDTPFMVDELLYHQHQAFALEYKLDTEFAFLYNTIKSYYNASLVQHRYTEKGVEVHVMISEPEYKTIDIVIHFWQLSQLYKDEDVRRFLDERENRTTIN